jgi:hypothetical protein
VSLVLGVDVAFSPAEVAARGGGAQFEVQCDIWDEDTFDDDWITKARKVIAPEAIASVVGVEFDFSLLLKNLRTREPYHESAIELYGELSLLRNGSRVSSAKSRTVNVGLPAPAPPPVTDPPSRGPKIYGRVSSSPAGTTSAVVVSLRINGHMFKALESIKVDVLTTISRVSEPPSSAAAEYSVVADANGSFVKPVGTTIHEQQRVQFDVKATGAISGASNAIVAFR